MAKKTSLAKTVLDKVNAVREASGLPTLTLVEIIRVKQQVVQGTMLDLCLGTTSPDGKVVEFEVKALALEGAEGGLKMIGTNPPTITVLNLHMDGEGKRKEGFACKRQKGTQREM